MYMRNSMQVFSIDGIKQRTWTLCAPIFWRFGWLNYHPSIGHWMMWFGMVIETQINLHSKLHGFPKHSSSMLYDALLGGGFQIFHTFERNALSAKQDKEFNTWLREWLLDLGDDWMGLGYGFTFACVCTCSFTFYFRLCLYLYFYVTLTFTVTFYFLLLFMFWFLSFCFCLNKSPHLLNVSRPYLFHWLRGFWNWAHWLAPVVSLATCWAILT